jgi:Ulp1 protease family, C-terminal catalytic domain
LEVPFPSAALSIALTLSGDCLYLDFICSSPRSDQHFSLSFHIHRTHLLYQRTARSYFRIIIMPPRKDKKRATSESPQQPEENDVPGGVVPLRQTNPVARAVWGVAGLNFNTFTEVLDHVRAQPVQQRVSLIRELNTALQQYIQQAGEYAILLVEFLEENENEEPSVFNVRNQDYHHAFKKTRDVARQARKWRDRLMNQQRNLIRRGYVNRDFIDHVLHGLLNESTATLDGLNSARIAGLGLIMLLNRASREMVRRLNNERGYNDGSTRITPADMKAARSEDHPNYVVKEGHLRRTGISGLRVDQYGIVWDHEPSMTAQRLLREESERPQAERPVPSEEEIRAGEPVVRTTRSQGQKRGFVEPEGSTASTSRQRKKTKTETSVPPPRLTPADVAYEDVERILRGIQGFQARTERKAGEQEKPMSPLPANPLPNPTDTQAAIYDFIARKVQAIGHRRVLDITPEVIRRFQGMDVSVLISDLQALGNVIPQVSTEDRVLATYAQAAFDIGSLILSSMQATGAYMSDMRRAVAAWGRDRQGLNFRVMPERGGNRGVDVNVFDLESFLVDEGHIGWLTGEAIVAAIMLGQDAHREHVVDPYVWTAWINGGQQAALLPAIPGGNVRDIVIPMHWGAHWTLIHIEGTQRRVHLQDSMYDPDRRRMAESYVRNFLHQIEGLVGTAPWTFDPDSGRQQLNTRDCGLFVIENALAIRAGEYEPEPIIAMAARRNWVQALQEESHEEQQRNIAAAALHQLQDPLAGTAGNPLILEGTPAGLARSSDTGLPQWTGPGTGFYQQGRRPAVPQAPPMYTQDPSMVEEWRRQAALQQSMSSPPHALQVSAASPLGSRASSVLSSPPSDLMNMSSMQGFLHGIETQPRWQPPQQDPHHQLAPPVTQGEAVGRGRGVDRGRGGDRRGRG